MELIKTQHLYKTYDSRFSRTKNYVLNDISLSIHQGEIAGLVGESGCGKSTLGRTLLGLEPFNRGELFFKETNIGKMPSRQLRKKRNEMQIIFQNSINVFDNRCTIQDIILEPVRNFMKLTKEEEMQMVESILNDVGLDSGVCRRYPQSLSGGQRQRVGIARALILNPKFIVCDEPIASLDFSIRKQVIELMKALKDKYQLTYLFISHDISVVQQVCDRIMVMYKGTIVEELPGNKIGECRHPYTRSLMSAMPIQHPKDRGKKHLHMKREEDSTDIATGCRFAGRCLDAQAECLTEKPLLREVDAGHKTACHFINHKRRELK